MTANMGDEFINQKDAVQYIYTGTAWQLRPFSPRPLASRSVQHTGSFHTDHDPWVTVPDATLQFRKSHDDTTLVVRGTLGGRIGNNDEGCWIGVHVQGTRMLVGGSAANVPPAHAGFFFRHGHVAEIHSTLSYYQELRGISKGVHTLVLLVGTEYGDFYHDTNDNTLIIVEEMYP